MPARKVAAEIKLIGNDYRKLPREVQLAVAGNIHEMAMKFAVQPSAPELPQPKPAKGRRTEVTDPPGMPIRRFSVRGAVDLRGAAKSFDAYADSLPKLVNPFDPAVPARLEIKHFSIPFGKAVGK